MTKKIKYCASCRVGERREEATCEHKGRMNGLPYHAFLCAEHSEMMYEDGYTGRCIELAASEKDEEKIVKRLYPDAKIL